jgi:twitching motility protein PilT
MSESKTETNGKATTDELNALLTKMLGSSEGISDLLFVAGKPPQVEVHGSLKSVDAEPSLDSPRIEGLARAIINGNARLAQDLKEQGSCDCSYSLGAEGRFRVNVYRQNGNFAMVLRRLQSKIPTMDALHLPPIFRQIIKEKTGIIFVTGSTGSGKTTTLAAMLNEINLTQEVHIVTLEDPVEFMHPHLKSVFSQRELGRDYFTFPQGLRAALRQAPKVIFVGEIRDRETMEIALTAGETGHVVYSTLHTISAGQSINRILGMFTKDEEEQVRERLAGTLRYIVSQRLVPKVGGGRLMVSELMGSNMRSREVIAMGENETRRLFDIIEAGSVGGWHTFEQSLLAAFQKGLITEETTLLNCTNKSAMLLRVDRAKKDMDNSHVPHNLKMRIEEEEEKPPVPNPAPAQASSSAPTLMAVK